MAHSVSIVGEEGASPDSIATSGQVVCPLSSFPLFFPECDGGSVYRIVLYDGRRSPRAASSSGSAIEAHVVGFGRSSLESGAVVVVVVVVVVVAVPPGPLGSHSASVGNTYPTFVLSPLFTPGSGGDDARGSVWGDDGRPRVVSRSSVGA